MKQANSEDARRLSRRHFLAGAAAGLAAWPLAGRELLAQTGATPGATPEPARALVVDVRDPAWQRNGQPDAAVIEGMLDRGLVRLTGQPDAAAAWARLFQPGERVLVKFNRLSLGFTGANQVLADLIAAKLEGAGLARSNIFVAEAVGARFEGGGRADRSFVRSYQTPAGDTRLTRLIEEQVDAIINVPNVKDHSIFGFTGALKNLSHAGGTIMEGPNNFHRRGDADTVPGLFSLPPIRDKLRLIVSDALKAVFEGGPTPRPQFTWDLNGLLLSLDPVAVDRVGLELVERERRQRGQPSLFRRRQRPVYVQRAGELGLGEADLNRIEWAQI